MKVIFSFFTALSACCNVIAQNTALPCERITYFGKVEICLPAIEGMKECYTDTLVKPVIDATEFKENDILGYYLTNSDFNSRSNSKHLTSDNYVKLSGVVKFRDYEADTSDLQKAGKVTEAHIQPQNWLELKEKIESKADDTSVGTPLLIKKYRISKNANTYILLTKFIVGKRSYMVAGALTLMLVNKRIVSMTYYKRYNSEKDIDTCQEKSDSMVAKILAANK